MNQKQLDPFLRDQEEEEGEEEDNIGKLKNNETAAAIIKKTKICIYLYILPLGGT